MAVNFPSNPTLNQIYSSTSKSWIWNGNAWKSYSGIGTVANSVVTQTTSSAGQTIFTTPQYVQGYNQIRVYINGVRQNNITDYAETSNTSITLTSGVSAGDNVAFEVSTYNGTPLVVNALTAVDDSSTNAIKYPVFVSSPGTMTTVNTDTADFTYNSATGTLSAKSINIGSTNVLDYVITYNLAFG
jgi:hypothetical protein